MMMVEEPLTMKSGRPKITQGLTGLTSALRVAGTQGCSTHRCFSKLHQSVSQQTRRSTTWSLPLPSLSHLDLAPELTCSSRGEASRWDASTARRSLNGCHVTIGGEAFIVEGCNPVNRWEPSCIAIKGLCAVPLFSRKPL